MPTESSCCIAARFWTIRRRRNLSKAPALPRSSRHFWPLRAPPPSGWLNRLCALCAPCHDRGTGGRHEDFADAADGKQVFDFPRVPTIIRCDLDAAKRDIIRAVQRESL